jgi:hypothetical protein
MVRHRRDSVDRFTAREKADGVRINVPGPLEIADAGEPSEIRGSRLRALVIRLARRRAVRQRRNARRR